MTGDGNILAAVGRQRRLATTRVESLERGLDDGIQLVVTREEDDSTHLQVEIDV